MSTIYSIVNMTKTISTRLERKEIKEIESFAKEEATDKSSFVRKLLHDSLEEYKTERAFRLYKEQKVTLWKAATLAGKSLSEMISLMKQYDAYLTYDTADFEKDLQLRIK